MPRHPFRNCRVFAVVLLLVATAASAQPQHLRLPLPSDGNDLVGRLTSVIADHDTTLVDIGVRYGYGYEELRAANPAVDAWLVKKGTAVTLPSRFILPHGPREGIVINTAEMRLYYYPPVAGGHAPHVEVFPVSIGRGDWSTPLVHTRVTAKQEDPAWYPPESIRREHAADGRPLGKVVPPGPDNPLGRHVLRLGIPSYLIHGTNSQYGIGMQVTHGCMRLFPKDIAHLHGSVPVNTPVRIVYQPYKLGWENGQLFLEVHPPLDGLTPAELNNMSPLVDAVTSALEQQPDYFLDAAAIQLVRAEANGLPAPVGPRPSPTSPDLIAGSDAQAGALP